MRRTSLFISTATFGICLYLAPVSVAEQGKADKPANPKEFIEGAIEANQLELRAGKLAQEKADSPAVKKLGKAMIEDHRKVKDNLRELASKHNVNLDGQLSKEHSQEWQRLENASGQEFDRAFLNQIINDHERDLSMLQRASKQWENQPELTALIERNLPMVRRHLEMAQAAARNDRAERQERELSSTSAQEIPDTEVLGLPTSNTDGTILGIIPAPSGRVEGSSDQSYIAEELADGKVDKGVEDVFDADQDAVGAPATYEREAAASRFITENERQASSTQRSQQPRESDQPNSIIAEELADGEVDPGVDDVQEADQQAVGAPPTSERERSASKFTRETDLPRAVRESLKEAGWSANQGSVRKVTVYEVEVNGNKLHATEEGKVYAPRNHNK